MTEWCGGRVDVEGYELEEMTSTSSSCGQAGSVSYEDEERTRDGTYVKDGDGDADAIRAPEAGHALLASEDTCPLGVCGPEKGRDGEGRRGGSIDGSELTAGSGG